MFSTLILRSKYNADSLDGMNLGGTATRYCGDDSGRDYKLVKERLRGNIQLSRLIIFLQPCIHLYTMSVESKSFGKPFLGYSSYFIGPSKTGKTTGIEDLLYSLKDEVAAVAVFCPTDATEGMYSGEGNKPRSVRIPKAAIHDQITAEMLRNILQRQEQVSAVYNKTRDPLILQSLFDRIATPENRAELARLKTITDRAIADLRSRGESTIMDQQDITSRYEERRVNVMRRTIESRLPHLRSILGNGTFSDDEQIAVAQFNINPEMLVILDDVTEQLRKLKGCPELEIIMTKGRYYHLTVIFAIHSIGAIGKDLRQTAFYNVYFGGGFEDYYDGGKTDIDKNKRIKARVAVEGIRRSHSQNPLAAPKLVWDRINERFLQTPVKPHDQFRFPDNDAFWELCEQARDRNRNKIKSSVLDRYKPQTH